jgi:ribonucleotide monophosphatase NagD (HAD superfamily)
VKILFTSLLAILVAHGANSDPLCVFDLGEILSKSNGEVADYTDQAFSACLENNFNVGVIAPPRVDKAVLEFLKLTNIGQYAEQFMRSGAFQLSSKDSNIVPIQKIVAYYDTKPSCLVVFDSGLQVQSKFESVGNFKQVLQQTYQMCLAPPEPSPEMNVDVLCVFDLGEILSQSNGAVAQLTSNALETCIKKKMQIGVITPPGKVAALVVDFITLSLGQNMGQKLVDSDAFQVVDSSESLLGIKNIMSFYQIEPSCVVVFDSGLVSSQFTKVSDFQVALSEAASFCNPKQPSMPEMIQEKLEAVCVFDLGEVLSKANGQVATLVEKAIETCIKKKYQLAVITPPGKVAALVVDFLTLSLGQSMANKLIDSQAFQVSTDNMSALKAIVVFYQIDPACVLVFDSGLEDSKYTKVSDYKMVLDMMQDKCSTTSFTMPSPMKSSMEGSSMGGCPLGASGVCAFDFDGTLHLGGGRLAFEARQAIQKCMDTNFQIGIVSRSGAISFLQKSLKGLMPEIFTDSFFASDAFQAGGKNKVQMLQQVATCYDVTPDCFAYFDDAAQPVAKEAGVAFFVVNSKTGIVESNVDQLLLQLPEMCTRGRKTRSLSNSNDMMEFEVETDVKQMPTFKQMQREQASTQGIVKQQRQNRASSSAESTMSEAPGVCIFNFDGVLHVGGGKMAPEALLAINECTNAGFKVGVVSSSQAISFLHKALSNFMPSLFTDEMLNSPAFQAGETDKVKKILEIVNYYRANLPSSILFATNCDPAKQAGIMSKVVNSKTGILASDAMSALPQRRSGRSLLFDKEMRSRVIRAAHSKAQLDRNLEDYPSKIFEGSEPEPERQMRSRVIRAAHSKAKLDRNLEDYPSKIFQGSTYDQQQMRSRRQAEEPQMNQMNQMNQMEMDQTGQMVTKGLCVFNFDGVLHTGGGRMAQQATFAINHCLENKFEIGVVSSSEAVSFLQKALLQLMPTVFTQEFLNSPAIQYGQKDKSLMIQNVMNYFGVRPECAVFFGSAPKAGAEGAGIKPIVVDSHVGITGENIVLGLNKLAGQCSVITRMARSMSGGMGSMGSSRKTSMEEMDTQKMMRSSMRRQQPYEQQQQQQQPQYQQKKQMMMDTVSRMKRSNDALSSVDAPTSVCVFNFDGVLHIGGGRMANDAKAVVDRCNAMGFKVGIVSSSEATSFLQKFLTNLFPTVFTPQLFNSPAFQTGKKDKVEMIKQIIYYYNTQPGCVVYFDDAGKNVADMTGVAFQSVEKNGITLVDFLKAMQTIGSTCKILQPGTTNRMQRIHTVSPPVDHPPFLSQSSGFKRSIPRNSVCIFGGEGVTWTKRVGELNKPSSYALNAIQACLNAGMEIALTSETILQPDWWMTVKPVLVYHFPGVFTEQFFMSNAFQEGLGNDKALAFEAIIAWYDAVPACSVIFDTVHKAEADYVGANYQTVDSQAGLTQSDFDQAMATLSQNSDCALTDFTVPEGVDASNAVCSDLFFEGASPAGCQGFRNLETCIVQCLPGYLATQVPGRMLW